jgi:hypothetical protein
VGIEVEGLTLVNSVLAIASAGANAVDLNALAVRASEALTKSMPALTQGRVLRRLAVYRVQTRGVQIVAGNEGKLTWAAPTTQQVPLQFVLSSNEKVALTLHHVGGKTEAIEVGAHTLVVFSGTAGFTVDVGRAPLLTGQLDLLPMRIRQ